MKSHWLILFTVKFSTLNMLRLAVALSVGGYMLTQLRCKQSLMEINSLETQMKKLEEEVAESRAKFKEVLQDIEKKLSEKKLEIERNMQSLKDLEVRRVELRRENTKLQEEKLELVLKIDFAESRITSIVEFQKQLNLKINSLEAQTKKVEEEVAEYSLVKKELESVTAENKENKELQRQMQMQIGMLEQRVAEVVELIRVNKELQDHEIRGLKKKLEACSQKPHQSKWKFCKIKDLVKWRYQLKS